MIVDFALNRKDGDLAFNINSKGFAEFQFITGADRILQKIVISLKMWLGEWFLDLTQGVPYLETIVVKGTRKTTIETILRQQIMNVEGVKEITFFTLDIAADIRLLTVNFEANTSEGPVKFSGALDIVR